MMTLRVIVVLLLLLPGACKKDTGSQMPVLTFWDVVPKDADSVLAFRKSILKKENLVAFLKKKVAAIDPSLSARVSHVEAACDMTVERDLIAVAVAHSRSSEASVLILQGNFRQGRQCLEALSAGPVETLALEGAKHAISFSSPSGTLYAVQVPSVGMVVSHSKMFIESSLKSDKPSFLRRHFPLVRSADAWAIGVVPSELRKSLGQRTAGRVSGVELAVATLFLKAKSSNEVNLHLFVPTEKEAQNLKQALKRELPQAAVIAQYFSFGPVVSAAQVDVKDKRTSITLNFTDSDLQAMLDAIDKRLSAAHTPAFQKETTKNGNQDPTSTSKRKIRF